MNTTLEGSPRQEDPPLRPASASRHRLASGAVTAALFLMVLVCGGSLYEHLVVDPVWPDHAAVIQPDRGGVNRKLFWMPIHLALTLALPLALWACWRNRAARRWLLVALGSYGVMRVWTMIYFVPLALRFEAEGVADVSAARTWVLLSV